MARFKENDLPKSKLTKSSLSKALLIFKYAELSRISEQTVIKLNYFPPFIMKCLDLLSASSYITF